jgi:hypothetical protein
LRFGFDHEGKPARLAARARFRAEAGAASGVIGNATNADYRICRIALDTIRTVTCLRKF